MTRNELRHLAALMILIAGCGTSVNEGPDGGDPDGGDPDGGPSLATPSAFCLEWVKVGSASSAFCFGGQVSDFLPSDVAFCQTFDGLLAKGTITYAASKAAACLAQRQAIPASTCQWSVPCYLEVITGQVTEGAPCALGECAPGLGCYLPNPRSCGPMICRRKPGLGESCDTLPCAEGLDCVEHVCAKDHPAVGEPCGPSIGVCGSGSACLTFSGDTPAVCRAGREGSLCADDSDCPFEMFCEGKNCQPRRAVGASCADAPQSCGYLARCEAETNVCVRAGLQNGPCGTFGYCLIGGCRWLDMPESSVCLADQPLGATCDSSAQCASGTCTDGVCAACTP